MVEDQLAVQRDGARLDPLGEAVGPGAVLRVDGAGQTVGRVVGQGDGLVLVVERQDGDHRPEDLLAVQPCVGGDVGEHGRVHEVSLALWEFGSEPGTALITEFMALANHRKTIRAEIAEIAERSREAQLESLTRRAADEDLGLPDVPPIALLVLMTMVSRGIMMENSLGVTLGHAEALAVIENILATVENRSDSAHIDGVTETRAAGL